MADIKWYDKKFMQNFRRERDRVLGESCKLIQDKTKSSMKPGTGRRYYSKRKDGSYHYASEPGQPPAPDTGSLKDSITYVTSSGERSNAGPRSKVGALGSKMTPTANIDKSVGFVGANGPVLFWMEMGVSKNNLDPRPSLTPAFQTSFDDILRLVKTMRISK